MAEDKYRAEGERIARALGNGVRYEGPWLFQEEFIGYGFTDKEVTGTSFVCKDLESCRAKLILKREQFHEKPPSFQVTATTGEKSYMLVPSKTVTFPAISSKQRMAERFLKEEGIEDLSGNSLNVDPNGMVTLYHRTSKESASQMQKTGKFISLENTDETFFSNRPTGQAEGYGDSIVSVKVPAQDVVLNDAFKDEIHVTVSNQKLHRANIIQPHQVMAIKENSALRTDPALNAAVKHLGYESVSLSEEEIAQLPRNLSTDQELIAQSQQRLGRTREVPERELTPTQKAHLKLAAALARNLFTNAPAIHAAEIPPASDRVQTAGMYGTSTGTIYIALPQLSRGRDAVHTLVHELGHHKVFTESGKAEDLVPGHAAAMKDIAARVVDIVNRGKLDGSLKDIVW